MHRGIAITLGLAVVVGLAQLAGAAEHPDQYNIEWEWTKSELRDIETIEKHLEKDDKGFWVLEKKMHDIPCTVRSDISPRFTAELALYTDYFLYTFPRVFPVPPAGKVLTQMDVVVYKDRSGYMSGTGAPMWSGGVHWVDFYGNGWPKLHVATFPWKVEKDKTPTFCKNFNRGTLQHEGTHALFRKWSGRAKLPVFINEGCATFFETWDLRDHEPGTEDLEKRAMRGFHMHALARKLKQDPDFKPSLRECVHMGHMEWGSGDIPLHYGLAESFMDYLLRTKKNRSIFRDMIQRIYKRRVAKATILTDKEIQHLEPGWHEHIRSLVQGLEKKIQVQNKVRAESGETAGVTGGDGVRVITVDPLTTSTGVTGWGQKLTLKLPKGVKITPEEFKSCKKPEDLQKLILEKLRAAR